MTLNQILEIANLNNVIDRAALAALTAYKLRRILQDHRPSDDANIVTPDIRHWSIRLCLATLVWSVGALILTVGVNLWRDQHLVIGVWVMVAGSIITVVGNIDLIRVLSLRRFGERVWKVVAALNVIYTVIALAVLW